MAYRITDACVNCGNCENECPVQAISIINGSYTIDPDACIDCGACEEVCQSSALEKA